MNILVFFDKARGVADGVKSQIVQLVRTFAARGHELRMMTPSPPVGMKDETAFVGAFGVWAWVPLIPVIRPWACLVGSAIALFQTMWREKPDVMIWFDTPGHVAPLICAGLMRCPYVPLFNGFQERN